MDAVILSMMAKMKAQLASLFTISAVNPYELFTDIVDGIEDVEDPADIAGKLEELKFTQTEVNKSIFRIIAHIKQAHNYKVNHNTLVYPEGLDEYDNLIFTQAVGKGTPPQFGDNEGISTLMYDKTLNEQSMRMTILQNGNVGINNDKPASQLDVGGDINTTTGYKINGNDITTDDITESTTNLYYSDSK
ncbi:hypothetical protein T484DRAFT_1757819, partial [Baffinella frigidus]